MDRLQTVVAPGTGSPTTSYSYDADGDLKTRQAPDGGVTGWTYDADDRPLTEATPVGEWQTTYNADGTVDTVEAPSTGTTTYSYDRMGRTTGIDYSDSTHSVAYTYDHAGRRTSMTDTTGETDYGYDADNRLTSVTNGSNEFDYAYSDGLNLTSESYPNGTSISNTYTDDEMLHTATSGGDETTFTYTPDDQLYQTAYPSGVGYTETRSYDADGDLDNVANTDGGTTLSTFAWTLNDDGEPGQIDTTRGSTTTHEALVYDAMDRLTEACYATTTCTGATNTIGYSYDKDSNVTQQVRADSVPNPGTTNYTYNSGDQLTQSVEGSTTTNYTYDANGDLASAGSDSYTYNLADELTATTQGSTTTNYTYDGDGNLASEKPVGGSETDFSWDTIGTMPMLASQQTTGGTDIATYLYGPQGALSVTTPSATSYLFRDPLGSITDVTDASGTPTWQYSYDLYGNPITSSQLVSGADGSPMRYAGQLLDLQTSQYQMRARVYDPASMRFDSQDPLRAPLNQSYTGAYVYADADPAALVDISGLAWYSPITSRISTGVHTVSGAVGAGANAARGAIEGGANQAENYVTSQTFGWCGDVSGGVGVYGTANGCFAFVGGHPTFTGTLGGGVTTSAVASANTGPLYSNANQPCQLAKRFTFYGASVDAIPSGGADYSGGTTPSGKQIGELYVHGGPGVAWTVVEAHTGRSYTWEWSPF